jgi:hypothetical protein
MGIFVLGKDQTFVIYATFLDTAKFSILVIHLLKIWKPMGGFSKKLKLGLRQENSNTSFWLKGHI